MKKGILRNPLLSGAVGFLSAVLLILYPMILIAIAVITGMVFIAFKDRIDFDELKIFLIGGENEDVDPSKIIIKKQLKKCPECGSTTKHKKSCPYYGKGKPREE